MAKARRDVFDLVSTPYQQWQSRVLVNQADWEREQGYIATQNAATTAATLTALDVAGEADLRATLAPWGAPVDSLLPRWRQAAKTAGLTLEDLAQGARDYFTQITNPDGNANWWAPEAWYRVPLQGAAIKNPGFNWSGLINTGLEAQQQKQLGVQLMAQQNKGGDDGFGAALAIIGAIAAVVTGGLSLAGTLAEAGVASAGLAEVAATAAAAGDAGFIGAAGATQLASASSGLSLSGAFGVAKNAFSVANGLNTLANGSPSPAQGTRTMPNPLYVAASNGSAVPNTGDAQNQQGAAPAQIGKTPPPSLQSLQLPFGLTWQTAVTLALAGAAIWVFWDSKKAELKD